MRKCIYLLIITILSFILNGCNNGEKIDTEILIVPETYKGIIVIFYEQEINRGHIEFRNGKHFFFVDSVAVFFTTKKLGGGSFECLAPDFDTNISMGPMGIDREEPDDKFGVVCGSYRGFKTNLYKGGSQFLRYTVYKSGIAKTLKKGGWYVSNSIVENLYSKAIDEKIKRLN